MIDRLVWVDRNGAVERGVAPELDGTLQSPRLSTDGERLAVNRSTAEGGHVYTKSLGSADAVRHTLVGQLNWRINWSPAGDAIVFDRDVGLRAHELNPAWRARDPVGPLAAIAERRPGGRGGGARAFP